MVIDYDHNPSLITDQKLQSLSDSVQRAIDEMTTSQTVVTSEAANAVSRSIVAHNVATSAQNAASAAQSAAQDAETYAGNALTAAQNAETYAGNALTAAQNAQTYAGNALTAAQNAETYAGNALTAAQNAEKSADAALVSLSNVEDVVGVLEWITAHGDMIPNGSTALDPAKVYFIVDDPNGDYVVGGTHYSIVSEPKAEDRTNYYTLSVDESVQNYVATHVVVDAEGLWLIPDSGGNKVLIATGAGSSYTTAGTYIIGKVNGVDTVFAKFTKNSATIGDDSNSSLEMTTRTFNVRDKENSTFFEVADMRNDLGVGTVTETWITSGEGVFILSVDAINTNYTVTVDGAQASPTKTTSDFSFNSPPSSGSTIQATYTSASQLLKQYTSGLREDNSIKGLMSFAEGYNITASGFCSHAEGIDTVARGLHSHAEGRKAKANNLDSHAEGYNAQANGSYSHAEGYGSQANGSCAHAEGENTRANGIASHASGNGTVAGYSAQTVIGKYNSNQSGNAFEIGKGNTENQRSNAFEVTWGGSVNIASGAKYKINGSNLSASDVGAVALSDKYTRSSTGDLAWTNQTDGNAKVIAKSALAFWNGAYNGSGSNLSKCSTGNIIGSNGGTMTGQLKTSFKTSVAMGSYGTAQTTVPNLVAEVRFSSGCMGSASINTAYTSGTVTIPTGWYNFIYTPHRSGGNSGSADGDNCNYGNLLLFSMTMGGGRYVIRVTGGSISEVVQILDSGSGISKTTWTPTSGSSYSNYGGCYYEKYGRVVHVHVGVSGLTANTATVVYTLPSAYRPSSTVFAHGTGGAWNNICYVEIYSDGRISVRSQGTYCGADITFLA